MNNYLFEVAIVPKRAKGKKKKGGKKK